MENEELNNEVVRVIFGIPQDQKDAWPWAIPEFSTDRNYCCQVILRMFVHEARHLFDEKIERAAMKMGWKGRPEHCGLSVAIMVLTPDEICKAALDAIREYDSSKQTLAADTRLP